MSKKYKALSNMLSESVLHRQRKSASELIATGGTPAVTIVADQDRWGNIDDIINVIITRYKVAPHIIRIKDHDFNELVDIFSQTHILIGVPSSFLSYLLFMPSGGVIVQVVPPSTFGLKLLIANLALVSGCHVVVPNPR